MKMHILHNLREEPWGGGNQFLKALRNAWLRQGVYAQNQQEADTILINSYPFGAEYIFNELWRLKHMHPKKIIVYRLNGPISHIRQKDKEVDWVIREWNRLVADGIVFQSTWCAEKNKEDFDISSTYQTVIHNAPDPAIFFPQKRMRNGRSRVKLIATSWSANPRKGFDLYKHLDDQLDFTKYEMIFVGNSPVVFKHIKMIQPVASHELAQLLRGSDIFVTASKSDPCSNSLIEALACGLPAVVLHDGGHPELLGEGGKVFEGTQDILQKIDIVANNLFQYQKRLPVFDIHNVAQQYLEFAQRIFGDAQERRYQPKNPRNFGLSKVKSMIALWKLKNVWSKLTGFFN